MQICKTKNEAITAITRMYMNHIGIFNIEPEDYVYSSVQNGGRNEMSERFRKYDIFEGNVSDVLDNNDYTKRVFIACHDKTCATLAMDENFSDTDYNTFWYLYNKKPDTFYMLYEPNTNGEYKVDTVSADYIHEILKSRRLYKELFEE